MKSLILILMVAILSACGQRQDVSKSSVISDEKIEGPIIMSSNGIEVETKGVCGYSNSPGRLELTLCSPLESDIGLNMYYYGANQNGYSFAAQVSSQTIVIDIVYRDATGIYNVDPINMNGRLELVGIY